MTADRPAFRVLGEPGARLSPRGCAMVVAALELAPRQAGRDGLDYRRPGRLRRLGVALASARAVAR